MERPELLGTRLFDLTDKIALVTGAGRGVGRTVALALAAAGADIVACARTAPEIEALCTEVRSLGRRAEAIVTDVTVEASCEHLITTTVERLGGLDILVNNAGINIRKPVLELSLAEFQRVLDTNEGAWRRVARARAQVPRSVARCVPVSGWSAQSPAAGGRQRGI
jgi:NAD(P)-dependent dehydrogenase (short-subunit alcohol dehydrogenase family)